MNDALSQSFCDQTVPPRNLSAAAPSLIVMHSDTQYILQAPNVLISSDLDTGGTKVGIPSYTNLAYTSNTGAALVPTPVAMTQDEGSPCCLCDIEQGDARPLRIKVFPPLICLSLSCSLFWGILCIHPHNLPLTPAPSPFSHLHPKTL